MFPKTFGRPEENDLGVENKKWEKVPTGKIVKPQITSWDKTPPKK
jgi:hypothetical protein